MKKLFPIIAMLVGVATNANAAGPDFSALTSAVDFTSVITGLMAVAVAVVGIYLAIRGAHMLLSFIRNEHDSTEDYESYEDYERRTAREQEEWTAEYGDRTPEDVGNELANEWRDEL